jgi:hypothetical protein
VKLQNQNIQSIKWRYRDLLSPRKPQKQEFFGMLIEGFRLIRKCYINLILKLWDLSKMKLRLEVFFHQDKASTTTTGFPRILSKKKIKILEHPYIPNLSHIFAREEKVTNKINNSHIFKRSLIL